MKHRWLAFVILLIAGALIVHFGRTLPSELSPMEDRSEFRIMAQGAEGATFEYMDGYVMEITNFLQREVPEHSGLVSVTAPGFGTVGVNSGLVRVILKDPDERERTQQLRQEQLGRALVNRDLMPRNSKSLLKRSERSSKAPLG